MEFLVTSHLIAILPPCHLVVIDDPSEKNTLKHSFTSHPHLYLNNNILAKVLRNHLLK